MQKVRNGAWDDPAAVAHFTQRFSKRKILFAMTIFSVLLTVVSLHVCAAALSQNITINKENSTLRSVMKEIERQTDYKFFYKQSLLKDAGRVDIQVKDATLGEALAACFGRLPYEYKIINKLIVLNAKNDALTSENKAEGLSPRLPLGPRPVLTTEIPPINVRGIVTNEDGEPVAGATVTVKGSNRATSTDGAGRFSLDANEKEILVITSVGFETQEIKLTAKDPSKGFRISMVKKTSDLDAVVILPYGTTTKD